MQHSAQEVEATGDPAARNIRNDDHYDSADDEEVSQETFEERKKKIEAEQAAEDERMAAEAEAAAEKGDMASSAMAQSAPAQPKDAQPPAEEDTKDFDELFGDSDSD